jgi:uncharacterized protein YndB with AHSA1/START domain
MNTSTPRDVVQQLEVAAPPDLVFAALVEPDQLRQWWGSDDMYHTEWEIDLRIGGEYRCTVAADDIPMSVRGRFLEIDPPTRLVYTWNASWDPTGETIVRFDLTPSGTGTLVQVTHSGFSATADRPGYDDGWGRILSWLTAWLGPKDI